MFSFLWLFLSTEKNYIKGEDTLVRREAVQGNLSLALKIPFNSCDVKPDSKWSLALCAFGNINHCVIVEVEFSAPVKII